MRIEHKFLKFLSIAAVLSMTSTQAVAGERYWENAQEAYTKVCAYCHKSDGKGVGPNTINIKTSDIQSRVLTIKAIVRNGLDAMPAFRKTEIDDDTLQDLATALAKGELK